MLNITDQLKEEFMPPKRFKENSCEQVCWVWKIKLTMINNTIQIVTLKLPSVLIGKYNTAKHLSNCVYICECSTISAVGFLCSGAKDLLWQTKVEIKVVYSGNTPNRANGNNNHSKCKQAWLLITQKKKTAIACPKEILYKPLNMMAVGMFGAKWLVWTVK